MPRSSSRRRAAQKGSPDPALAHSYATLFERLLPGLTGSLLFDKALKPSGSAGTLAADADIMAWLESLDWKRGTGGAKPVLRELPRGACVVAFPFVESQSAFLGAACVQVSAQGRARLQGRHEAAVTASLAPALECLHRELSHQAAAKRDDTVTIERTQDLEWLFNVAGVLKREGGDSQLLRGLLIVACDRMETPLALVSIPDKQLSLWHAVDGPAVETLRQAAQKAEPHLHAWAVRRREPLMVNEPPRMPSPVPPVKFLSVPLLAAGGRVLGFLGFFRHAQAGGFSERQQYLAGHVAAQVVQLVESQFDLMTGLPIRAALEQHFESLCEQNPRANRSLLYLDIDELHICNERFGFELGDEVIVRVAQALTSGVLPPKSLAARLSADSFAVLVDGTDPRDAAAVARRIQDAVRAIRIGPDDEPLKVSLSCGIAAVVDMPKGFARALAAAELACKAAKDRGRDRVEVYACEDASMMRRHDDVILVGQLREAIRDEQVVLFAQPIVALERDRPLRGFEVLIRMRNEDGSLTPPGKFMSAAQRYQLMPQIDRYVLRRALEIAEPYAGVLREMKATLSVNISGQSIVDESFVDYMLKTIRESRIPPGLVCCEVTEQTAVSSLATAARLMGKLRAAGCGVALDDFGVGANTFAYLKGLPISRIKIDGSFVRDMLTNQRSAAMVGSLVSLAEQFDLDTVAEYVENDKIAAVLQAMGVGHAQGFAFGRPEDMEQVLSKLRAEESRRMRALWLES